MPAKVRFFYGYIIVIISFFIMMAIIGMHSSFGVFFKPMIAELGWSRAITSGAFSLSMIMTGLLGIVIGGLNDRFGPRVVLTICGFLAGLGYLLTSQVHTAWQLYLFYGTIIGFGSGVFVPLLSTVARWFVRRRSMMSGIVAAGMGVGMLFLPLMINRLIFAYGWRVSCLIFGIIIMVFVVLTAQFLRRDPEQVGQAAYGESNTVEESPDAGAREFSLKEALFTRQFWVLFAMLICFGFCFFSLLVHIAPYITDLGISAKSAAKVLATVGGASIIGQIALGSIGDKIGNRQAFLIGTVLIAIAVFGLMLMGELWTFYLFAVILGLAYGNMSTQESPLIAWLFGLTSHGLIFGFFAFSFTIGASIGPVLFGYIFDVTGNYRFAFLLCAAISIFNIILTMFLKPISTEPPPKS
ncbi:MAG: MFS transporter [Deltaproteobacteria bacterium]|nr:MFS transporter [Deltaproteobacteria bacterium]